METLVSGQKEVSVMNQTKNDLQVAVDWRTHISPNNEVSTSVVDSRLDMFAKAYSDVKNGSDISPMTASD
jgi:hypothetical protein